MFCTSCGTQNKDGVKFCSNCGQKLKTVSTKQAEESPWQETQNNQADDASVMQAQQSATPSIPVSNMNTVNSADADNRKKLILMIGITAATIILVVAAVLIILYFGNTTKKTKILECSDKAIELMSNNDIDGAKDALGDIDLDYVKNNCSYEEYYKVKNIVQRVQVEKQKQEMVNPDVGKIIKFGSYKQNSSSDEAGVKDLEWIVVDTKGSTGCYLLCKDVIDVQPYDDKSGTVCWNTSSIKKWLNTDFYQTAFSDYAKNMMLTVQDMKTNTGSTSDNSNRVKEKVSLLSSEQAASYLKTDDLKKASCTDYAKSKNYNNKYWLRTSAGDTSVYDVNADTGTITETCQASDKCVGVRPLICINSSIAPLKQVFAKTKDGSVEVPAVADLKDFLNTFKAHSQLNAKSTGLTMYDSERPYEVLNSGDISPGVIKDILTSLLDPATTCVNPAIYPISNMPIYTKKYSSDIDPLSRFNSSSYMMYTKWDQNSVNWILKNVFNCNDENIEKLVKECLGKFASSWSMHNEGYVSNGNYYKEAMGTFSSFGDFDIDIDEASFDGEYYYFKYKFADIIPSSSSTWQPIYAKMKLKESDGIKYWSLYKLSCDPITS